MKPNSIPSKEKLERLREDALKELMNEKGLSREEAEEILKAFENLAESFAKGCIKKRKYHIA